MTPFAGGGLQSETSEKSSIAPLLPPEQLFDHENSQLLLRTAKLENTSAWAQLCGDDAVEPPLHRKFWIARVALEETRKKMKFSKVISEIFFLRLVGFGCVGVREVASGSSREKI